jgi:hypothetical protein
MWALLVVTYTTVRADRVENCRQLNVDGARGKRAITGSG